MVKPFMFQWPGADICGCRTLFAHAQGGRDVPGGPDSCNDEVVSQQHKAMSWEEMYLSLSYSKRGWRWYIR